MPNFSENGEDGRDPRSTFPMLVTSMKYQLRLVSEGSNDDVKKNTVDVGDINPRLNGV
jgi:hypothetical protein